MLPIWPRKNLRRPFFRVTQTKLLLRLKQKLANEVVVFMMVTMMVLMMVTYGSIPRTQIQKKCSVEDRFVNNGYTKTAISTLILSQTCADCLESCITMYYMIPRARRKVDAESRFLQWFSSQRLHKNSHINSYSGSNLRRAL